ncbi:Rrf2 family transcriptional regulator, partial [Enterococcus faecium]
VMNRTGQRRRNVEASAVGVAA